MEEEEFRILGHSMCFSSSNSCKRFVIQPGLEMRRAAVRAWGNQPLCVADPDIHHIVEKEKQIQFKGIELIASENFVCRAVMEALGSHSSTRQECGGARYCGGSNLYIDQIELLNCECTLAAFHLNPDYDNLEEKALDFRSKIIICGGSSYQWEWDYAMFRQIAVRSDVLNLRSYCGKGANNSGSHQ